MTNIKFKKAASLMVATGMAASCFVTTSFASSGTENTTDSDTAAAASTDTTAFSGDADLTLMTVNDDRAYDLYQIFKGDYEAVSDTDSEELINIEWGDSVSAFSSDIVKALKASTAFGTTNPFASLADTASADDVADVVKDFTVDGVTDTDKVDAFAKVVAGVVTSKTNVTKLHTDTVSTTTGENDNNYTFNDISAGYYLVTEVKNEKNEDPTFTYSKYMVSVVGGSETAITTKEVTGPTITKGILTGDEDIAATTKDESVTTVDDVAVEDIVKFRLDSSVPKMTNYDKYYFVANDTLAEGMTIDKNSFTVKVGDKTLTQTDDEDSTGTTFHVDYDTTTDGTTKFHVVIDNFIQYKANEGAKIQIFYNAQVNEKVVSGNTKENKNKVDLTYSNDPNYDYDGTNEPTDDEKKNGATNTTPESTVYVYTAGIEIIKVDSKSARLTGAEFSIKKVKEVTDKDGKTVLDDDGNVTYEEDTLNAVIAATQTHTPIGYASDYATSSDKTVYYKLKRGAYTSTAPTDSTKSSYVAAEPVKYAKVEGDEGAEDTYTKSVNGGFYKDTATGSYVLITEADKDTSKYESDYVAYERTTTPTLMDKESGDFVGEVSENGTLIVDGLSAGTYQITETKAPEGFNELEKPITVTVSFNSEKDEVWSYYDDTSDNYSATNPYSPKSGIYELKVVNTKGNTLPSTGGIGTTIFYVAGSVLLAAGGVLLVTKKRMNKSEQ
jgi:fimbrial isopeptide formation D2 family protein/LPXTG-motif cell wall-anchored protein